MCIHRPLGNSMVCELMMCIAKYFYISVTFINYILILQLFLMIAPKALLFLENMKPAWPTDTQNPRSSKLDSLSLHPRPTAAAPLCSLALVMGPLSSQSHRQAPSIIFDSDLSWPFKSNQPSPLKCIFEMSLEIVSYASSSPFMLWFRP